MVVVIDHSGCSCALKSGLKWQSSQLRGSTMVGLCVLRDHVHGSAPSRVIKDLPETSAQGSAFSIAVQNSWLPELVLSLFTGR